MNNLTQTHYDFLADMLDHPVRNAPFETEMEKFKLCSNDGKYLHITDYGVEMLKIQCEDRILRETYFKPLDKVRRK